MNEAPVLLTVYEGGKTAEKPVETKPDWQGGGDDWLRRLEYGDRFLSCGKNYSGAEYDQWGIAFILPEAILLACFQTTGMTSFHWYDSLRFSNANKFVALLPDMKPDKEAGNNGHHLLGPTDGKAHDGHEGTTPDIPE